MKVFKPWEWSLYSINPYLFFNSLFTLPCILLLAIEFGVIHAMKLFAKQAMSENNYGEISGFLTIEPIRLGQPNKQMAAIGWLVMGDVAPRLLCEVERDRE